MELIKKIPKSLEIVRYTFEFIDGNPKIIIHQIKVLDEKGKYIKFASNEKVFNYLSKFPISFKEI